MAHGTTRRQILQYLSQKMMHFFKNEGWKSFIVMSGLFVLKKNVFYICLSYIFEGNRNYHGTNYLGIRLTAQAIIIYGCSILIAFEPSLARIAFSMCPISCRKCNKG